ncbi:cation:proton antiporter [Alkalihalobacterium chitinilyticum]|uniref:Cation:proton antiporter n=1 Tax=Alkalihalobacterium chitinilyticum TaxID=2980103 RepID=A0ABT5VB35_9BACI|nr:cation:proton antiporter [Alkalihalobacterium chitinilyticum]MDE5412655.1 cation:proton antiporter [Alkalihalobacterium chitinilyticum]
MNILENPISNPVLIFAIAMVVFLLAPIIMARIKVPGLIGLIFAGVIIGPKGLGILDRDPTIILLGTVGLLYIIFIAGLEIDLEGFKKYRQRSIVFGSLSFTIPFIFGTSLGLLLQYSVPAAILLGSLLGSHTLLAYPIASRLGISKNKSVTTTVGGTIMTDTSALLILAIIAASMEGELNLAFWFTMILSLVLYVGIVFLIIPTLARYFFRSMSSEGTLDYIFVMAVLFVTAFFATVAGLEPIIGAFLAGLALNRFILEHSPLMNRIKFVGNAIFIPFFLLSVGMLMDIRVLLSEPSAWILAAAIVLFVQLGKFLAAWVSGKLYKYSKDEVRLMFGLSVPQAAATLAATLVGFDLGLFDQATVNGVIVMILVTCMVGPYTVEKYGRRLALLEEQQPYEPSSAPDRILVPLANPNSVENLLNLSFSLRGNSTEPIYPLTVAREQNGRSAEKVAEAEKMLGKALTYASGANIPVHLLTRVDPNVSSGIIRAIEETRITKIVIGWNGKLSTPQKIFGGVLDQLLNLTNEMVLVSMLGHPLNTTKRIVLILPSGVDHKSGYYEGVKTIKEMANNIGAKLSVLIIKDDSKYYKKSFEQMKPDVSMKFANVKTWNELIDNYLLMLKKDDLVVVLSARRGTIAWHPKLEEIPRILAKSIPESFIILFPPERDKVDLRGSRGTDVPRTLLPRREFDD